MTLGLDLFALLFGLVFLAGVFFGSLAVLSLRIYRADVRRVGEVDLTGVRPRGVAR